MSRTIITFLSIVVLFSCGHVPQTHYYTLDYPLAVDEHPARSGTLYVAKYKTEPPHDQDMLIYRPSPFQVKFDHYHRWIMSPADLLTQKTVDHLRALALFDRISLEPPRSSNCTMLSGTVKQFEEVIRGSARIARVELWIEICDFRNRNSDRLWSGSLSGETRIIEEGAEGIIKAMSQSTKQVLDDLADKLEKL
jgi:uncharacterized lipoprotein YmbA